jgi:hypothetical protein
VISGQHRDVATRGPDCHLLRRWCSRLPRLPAVFRFKARILTVLGGSCAAALALRHAGLV